VIAVADVLARLQPPPRRTGRGFSARCPVPSHPDRHNSLSIGTGRNGAALRYCHRGCSYAEVIAALGLERRAAPADYGRSYDHHARVRVARQQPWVRGLPRYHVADLLRRLRAVAAAIQHGATLAGPDAPMAWSLVALAADLEREAYLLEAVLDDMRPRRAA
jgi:hypothetical protein